MASYKMFDFDTRFRLGIEGVDKEHEQLVNILNRVSQLLDENKLREALEYFSKTLSDYVNEHFSNEEKFMENMNYPQLEIHREAHKKFQDSFNELKPKIEQYDENAFRKSLLDTFLWLISHTGKIDRDYADYYRNANLAKLSEGKHNQ